MTPAEIAATRNVSSLSLKAARGVARQSLFGCAYNRTVQTKIDLVNALDMSLPQRSFQPHVSHNSGGFVVVRGVRSFVASSAEHEPRRRFPSAWFSAPASDDSPEPADGATSLEDVARGEQEFLRQRLREELKREPTEEELSEWLREHTEGY